MLAHFLILEGDIGFFSPHLSALNCGSHSTLMFYIFSCQGLGNFMRPGSLWRFLYFGALRIWVPYPQILSLCWRFNLSSIRYKLLCNFSGPLEKFLSSLVILCHGFNRPTWQSPGSNSQPFSSWESMYFSPLCKCSIFSLQT